MRQECFKFQKDPIKRKNIYVNLSMLVGPFWLTEEMFSRLTSEASRVPNGKLYYGRLLH